jgi:hypothetical protein
VTPTPESWNVVLAFSLAEDAETRLEQINRWLTENGRPALRRMAAPRVVPMFGAMLRGLSVSAFLDLLADLPWRRSECVQLLLREPGEGRWAVINVEQAYDPTPGSPRPARARTSGRDDAGTSP